ncbi:MAG: zinc ribbon domain-containing protein [Bacillota bacterium]
MFCSHCGEQLNPEAKFCARCGKAIAGASAESGREASAPPQANYPPPVQPPAAPKSAVKNPRGKHVLFGVCGMAAGAILLALILFAAGVFAPAAGGTIEGPGFATPEDAAKAYLNGLRDQDMDAMLSAFAVESYVEHYDLKAMVERIRMYQPGLEVPLPNTTEYTRRMNIASRTSQIAGAAITQYLYYNAPDELNGYAATVLKDPQEVADFMEKFERDTKSYVFEDLAIADVLRPEDLSPQYLAEANQENIKRQAKTFGAGSGDVANLAIAFEADGRLWLFCPQAVRYGGRWYLQSLQGNLANLLGMPVYSGGIMPADLLGP